MIILGSMVFIKLLYKAFYSLANERSHFNNNYMSELEI